MSSEIPNALQRLAASIRVGKSKKIFVPTSKVTDQDRSKEFKKMAKDLGLGVNSTSKSMHQLSSSMPAFHHWANTAPMPSMFSKIKKKRPWGDIYRAKLEFLLGSLNYYLDDSSDDNFKRLATAMEACKKAMDEHDGEEKSESEGLQI